MTGEPQQTTTKTFSRKRKPTLKIYCATYTFDTIVKCRQADQNGRILTRSDKPKWNDDEIVDTF